MNSEAPPPYYATTTTGGEPSAPNYIYDSSTANTHNEPGSVVYNNTPTTQQALYQNHPTTKQVMYPPSAAPPPPPQYQSQWQQQPPQQQFQPVAFDTYNTNKPPVRQRMFDGGTTFLNDCDALLVRQKLQLLENICVMCVQRNQYRISRVSLEEANRRPPLTDSEFFQTEPRGFIQEQSSFCCRCCCGRLRELKFGVFADEMSAIAAKKNSQSLFVGDSLLFDRPFRFPITHPILTPCCMLCKPVIYTKTSTGHPLGSAELEWNCTRCLEVFCCGRCYLAVKDANHQTRFYMRPEQPVPCNGCRNCCAPTCCNRVWEADILDVGGQVVGNYRDNYPGYVGCRCCSNASNFSLTFPPQCTPTDKANLLGALMLAEMLFHERPMIGQQQ